MGFRGGSVGFRRYDGVDSCNWLTAAHMDLSTTRLRVLYPKKTFISFSEVPLFNFQIWDPLMFGQNHIVCNAPKRQN